MSIKAVQKRKEKIVIYLVGDREPGNLHICESHMGGEQSEDARREEEKERSGEVIIHCYIGLSPFVDNLRCISCIKVLWD